MFQPQLRSIHETHMRGGGGGGARPTSSHFNGKIIRPLFLRYGITIFIIQVGMYRMNN